MPIHFSEWTAKRCRARTLARGKRTGASNVERMERSREMVGWGASLSGPSGEGEILGKFGYGLSPIVPATASLRLILTF